jgi:adenylate cyclase
MKELLLSIIKKIPRIGSDPTDSDEIRLKKSLLASASVLVILAAAVWGTTFCLLGELSSGIISLFYSMVTLGSLVYFSHSHKYRVFLFSQLVMGLLLPFCHMILLGGVIDSSAVFLWSLISPLGALIFYGPKQALFWWLAYIGLLVAGGVLTSVLHVQNYLTAGWKVTFFVLNLGGVSSIVIVMLNYFNRKRNEVLQLLRIEEKKADNLLLNILPKEIAIRLKNEERTIAEQFDCASILFADLVGFTSLTTRLAPDEMVTLLNDVFSHFDTLVEKYGLEKIRTIGDNYMVAAGAPRRRKDHAQALARMALEMRQYIGNLPLLGDQRVEFRIGINSGPVIGGVIGRRKFVYDLWGDAVNIASRMESQGLAGKIQITSTTRDLIQEQFLCKPRGTVSIKGRGEMKTWFLEGVKSPEKSPFSLSEVN